MGCRGSDLNNDLWWIADEQVNVSSFPNDSYQYASTIIYMQRSEQFETHRLEGNTLSYNAASKSRTIDAL